MVKKNGNTYQYWMLRIPVANSKSALPTSSASMSRSRAWAGLCTAGHSNSFGITDHSFASRIGNAARPSVTWAPWVNAYSQLGWVG